jgi:hypothetical protein
MNSLIPIEHLKTIWKTFSEVNTQIKELNEKILSLKDYIDVLIPGVDTAEFVTKSQIFKDGDPEKGVKIKKGDPFTALDPDTTNLYIGGDYIGDIESSDHSNVVIGPETLTKGPIDYPWAWSHYCRTLINSEWVWGEFSRQSDNNDWGTLKSQY